LRGVGTKEEHSARVFDMNRRKFIRNTGITLGAMGLAGYAGYRAIDSKITPDLGHSLLVEGTKKWSNWSGSQVCEPKEFFLPNNEVELIEKLKKSTQKIRVVGGGHSFSPVVPSNEILSSIRNIKGIVSHDPKTNIAVINAGSHLYDLTEEMHQAGYAFPNQGDINRQSLGGAVSTSTHGTGETLQSFAGIVRGFRLITANGEAIDWGVRIFAGLIFKQPF
jgi:FAD/FMN-containing dehydrogenase